MQPSQRIWYYQILKVHPAKFQPAAIFPDTKFVPLSECMLSPCYTILVCKSVLYKSSLNDDNLYNIILKNNFM